MDVIKYIDQQIKDWTEVYNNPDMEKYKNQVMARIDTLKDVKRKAEELERDNAN